MRRALFELAVVDGLAATATTLIDELPGRSRHSPGSAARLACGDTVCWCESAPPRTPELGRGARTLRVLQ
jgi:hypothetical protein